MKTDTMYLIGNGFLIASFLTEKGELYLLLLGILYLVLGMCKEFWERRVEEEDENERGN